MYLEINEDWNFQSTFLSQIRDSSNEEVNGFQ
jgi:hypothetical protein